MQLRRVRFIAFVILVGLVATHSPACRRDAPAAESRLTLFTGAGLADVVGELVARFTGETGIEVDVSPAASGVLRKQIEAGAACDVFVSADPIEIDRLVAKGLVQPERRQPVAANTLVVIRLAGGDSAGCESLACLVAESSGRIAIGDPAYVPAGRYARNAMEAAGVWEKLQPRLVAADNVRIVCQYVRTNQAEWGLAYATDAARMDDIEIAFRLDKQLTGPVECDAAVCSSSQSPKAALRLLAFLAADRQSDVWRRHGFEPSANGE